MKLSVALVSMFLAAAHAGYLVTNDNIPASLQGTESENLVITFVKGREPLELDYTDYEVYMSDPYGGGISSLYLDKKDFVGVDWEAYGTTKLDITVDENDNKLTAGGDPDNWYLCEDFQNTRQVLFYGERPGCVHVDHITFKE